MKRTHANATVPFSKSSPEKHEKNTSVFRTVAACFWKEMIELCILLMQYWNVRAMKYLSLSMTKTI